MGRRTPHFSQGRPLHDLFDARRRSIDEELRKLTFDQVLATPLEDLVESLVARYRVEPLELDADAVRIDRPREHEFERPDAFGRGTWKVLGVKTRARIPLRGSREVLEYQPSECLIDDFQEEVNDHNLEFDIEIKQGVGEDASRLNALVRAEIDSVVSRWQRQIGYINKDLAGYNDTLETEVRQACARRRTEALNFKAAMPSLPESGETPHLQH